MSKLKTTTQNLNFFERVYEIVKMVPVGKVTTYGNIALRLSLDSARDKRSGPFGSRINISPRTIGWALHANCDPNVPCHRVVNKDGRLAPGYTFGGPNEQRNRLLAEGVTFLDKAHVDLSKCLWTPK